MLLNFTVKNYKSFRDENIFSMVPAPKQKGLDYSICCEKIKRKNVKALCSAVMYGPNASGKTNIIGAMDTFCAGIFATARNRPLRMRRRILLNLSLTRTVQSL